MDKLTRYNQKLLAIIGTTIIAAAAIALVASIFGVIISFMDFSSSDDNGIRVQDPNATTADTTSYIRTQEVTFNTPIQLDTTQAKFLIPVGQVNLEKKETIDIGSGAGVKYSDAEYRYLSYYGLFNNFIFFNFDNGVNERLFDKQVAITEWSYLKNDSIEVLLFKGTSTDDNSDNRMDSDDYQSLFAYYLNDKKLVQYEFDDKTVLDFNLLKQTDLVTIKLGVDKDKDFKFERKSEPQLISSLNIRTRQVEEIISQETRNEIQSIIDGRK